MVLPGPCLRESSPGFYAFAFIGSFMVLVGLVAIILRAQMEREWKWTGGTEERS